MAKSFVAHRPAISPSSAIQSQSLTSRNAWRSGTAAVWLLACLALLTSLALPAQAAAPALRIESFKVLNADAESADIEFVASTDESQSLVSLVVMAKSKDGIIHSSGGLIIPAFVLAGQHVHFTARVFRPVGSEAQQTDVLLVTAYLPDQTPLLRERLEWQHAWPESTAKLPGGLPNGPDLDALNAPWKVFHNNLLGDEDYAALDLLLEEWNKADARDANGDWKLDGFRLALDGAQGNDWNERLQRIQRWEKANPKSAGAAIAEARHWASYAWHIRGCRCKRAAKPDPVALRVFKERMARAEKVLLNSKSYASGNPLWYETYLSIAIDRKRDDAFIGKLFEEAVARHAHFQPLYVAMAKRWTPELGGAADWGKVDELVTRAVSLTSDTDGQDNYARIYAQISGRQDLDVDVLQDGQLSWLRMRDSFHELVKRYPSADNLNEFAAFACRAGDKEDYLNLSVKIQGHIVPDKWPSNYSIDLCNRRFMQES